MELGPITGTFGDLIGQRIQECRQSLASRWLHRLTSLLPVDTAAVFPTQELLDHIPELFDEVGVYLRTPETEGIAANSGVINPLNVLQFTTEALERNGGDPEARARLTSILHRNVDHATSIVRALAGLTLGRAALDGPAQQQVDVSGLARKVVRQLQEMATERDVELLVSPNLPTVLVVPGKLELILMNLVSNGFKYSDRDKTQRFVEIVPGTADDRECAICIRDNGIGISPVPAKIRGRVSEINIRRSYRRVGNTWWTPVQIDD